MDNPFVTLQLEILTMIYLRGSQAYFTYILKYSETN